MEKLTSDYGVIIKWSDYFIECYDYCPELLSFIDDTGSWLEPGYIFITEKELIAQRDKNSSDFSHEMRCQQKIIKLILDNI